MYNLRGIDHTGQAMIRVTICEAVKAVKAVKAVHAVMRHRRTIRRVMGSAVGRGRVYAGMLLLVVMPVVAVPLPDAASVVAGRWVMEDVYTLQFARQGGITLESHAPGVFSYDVVLNPDGTGTIDGEPFAWSLLEDEMLWRFARGVTVSSLTRVLDADHFLLLALGSAGEGAVGSVSSLVRVGRE